MRVLVVGASGAIGTRLVPQLRERGHDVIGSARTQERLREVGAEGIVLDALDEKAVREAIAATKPTAIIYEPTSLADLSDFKHFNRSFAQTNRLRTEGIDILLRAAREAGVHRIVAQSYGCHRYAREGGPVKTEDDRLDSNPATSMRETLAATAHLDHAVTSAGGVALRYGSFYGDPVDPMGAAVRAGKVPIIGNGNGIWSFIHVEDAAAATVLALEHDRPAIYNIADDEPAPVRVWLPELAKILGAKPPPHFPRFLARILAGDALVVMFTESRGASNGKAKRELGFAPRYPSWRQGFAAVYEHERPMANGLTAERTGAVRQTRGQVPRSSASVPSSRTKR